MAKNNATKLLASIASFANNVKDIHKKLASLATQCVLHAVDHGDNVPANKLIDAIDGQKWAFRSNDLRQWFEQTGPFIWDNETKTLAFSRTKCDTLAKVIEEETRPKFSGRLVRDNFWTVKKEAKYQGFNVESILQAMINKAERIQQGKAANIDPTKVDMTGLDEARSVLDAIKSNKVIADDGEIIVPVPVAAVGK